MGRFRVLERIGSGGMGTVYRAFDERLQREVAVKEITAGDPERILREAHAAARLNHPGIVTLYELGEDHGHSLLVSELVDGLTLDELAAEGELTDRDVASVGARLCDALSHAHARGVIHRDIKPQNVIVREDDEDLGRPKLMDFGIASLADAPRLTAPGEVMGTLAYMAPEQADGDEPGSWGDVYSLALTLYEAWAGSNPVLRDTPAATVRAIGERQPSLREYRPDLPPELTDAIDAALDPDPAVRPTVEALHAALEDAVPQLDGLNPVPAPERSSGAAPARRPVRAALVAAMAVAAAGLSWIGGAMGHPEAAFFAAVACGLAAAWAEVGWRPSAVALPVAAVAAGAWGADALVGPLVLALTAVTFAPILRLGHVALGVGAALLWAAGLDGLMRALAGAGIAGPPQVVAVMAVAVAVLEFRARPNRAPEERRPADAEPSARLGWLIPREH